MVSENLQAVLDWLRRVITEPRHELTRWQAAVRFAYDLGRYGTRQLARDQAPQMAAALSFRTLFSLLPVVVVGTVVVKAFGGFERFITSLEDFLGSLGLDAVQEGGVTENLAESSSGGAATAQSQQVTDWIITLFEQAQNINLTVISWVGVGVLIVTALSLMVAIEGSFNRICRAPSGRSWFRRIPIYWTVLSLGPAAFLVTMWADQQFDEFILVNVPKFLIALVSVAWGFIASWLLMFLVYKLLPNTVVHTRPALVGAFVSACLLEIGKRTLGAYLENVLAIQLLYGSLGLIPLFMFWVYLMWLIVLFGLEVAAILQQLEGRTLDEIERQKEPTGLVDPAAVISIMEIIAARFQGSASATPQELSEETGIPVVTVTLMLERLIDIGVLHRLERRDGAVSLARPPERIAASDLIDAGFALVDEGGIGPRTVLLQAFRDAQRALAAKATLAGLLQTRLDHGR